MSWNISGNSLMRSSVDLIGIVILGVGDAAGAGSGLSGLEVFLGDFDGTVHLDVF